MPVFTRQLLDVTGCDIPSLDLSTAEKKLLDLIGSDEGAFQNPIEGAMGKVQGSISDILTSINNAGGPSAGITIDVITNADGSVTISENPLGSQTTFGFLAENLELLNGNVDEFRIHSDRLSGVSVANPFGSNEYGPGGIQGEYPGIAGLHAIASQFNSLQETFRDPAQAAKDHYSPIFNSLFGPGDDMMRSLDSLVSGDIGNFLTNFPTGGNPGGGNSQAVQDLARLGSSLKDFQASIPALINDDNLQFEFAIDYIAKKTTGLSILSMLDDPCFGTRLLNKVGKGEFKAAANQVTGLAAGSGGLLDPGIESPDDIGGSDEDSDDGILYSESGTGL
tara:strand:+ start:2121 stop:3128 length:1008 start_codon:yes stop_codon:yes gene_type:complete